MHANRASSTLLFRKVGCRAARYSTTSLAGLRLFPNPLPTSRKICVTRFLLRYLPEIIFRHAIGGMANESVEARLDRRVYGHVTLETSVTKHFWTLRMRANYGLLG